MYSLQGGTGINYHVFVMIDIRRHSKVFYCNT